MKIFTLAAALGTTALLAFSLLGQEAPPVSDQGGALDQGAPADQAPPDQPQPPAQSLTPDQLANLVAPIALYPDTLLSQILVASTYPIEVVEAQQWLQQHTNFTGKKLLDEARKQKWDPSVQALVPFPDILARLNQDIRWTTDLGNAFLAQQPDVMNAVQQLRAKAQANGKLQSNPQETVTTQNDNGQTAIDIAPANPEEMYVPAYNPAFVWGPPIYGVYPPLFYPGIDVGFSFLPGIDLGFYFGGDWGLWGGFGWGWGPDWFGHRILLNDHFFHRYGFHDDHRNFGGVWAHDPGHRLGVPYGNRAVAGRFNGSFGARGGEGFHGGNFAARGGGHFAEPSHSGFGANHSAFGGIRDGGVTRMQSDHGFSSMGHSGGFGGGGGFHGGGGGFHGGGGGFHGGGGGGHR